MTQKKSPKAGPANKPKAAAKPAPGPQQPKAAPRPPAPATALTGRAQALALRLAVVASKPTTADDAANEEARAKAQARVFAEYHRVKKR